MVWYTLLLQSRIFCAENYASIYPLVQTCPLCTQWWLVTLWIRLSVPSICPPIYAILKVNFRTAEVKTCLTWLFSICRYFSTRHCALLAWNWWPQSSLFLSLLCNINFGVLAYGMLSHKMSDLDFHGLRARSAKFQYFIDDTNKFITIAKMQLEEDYQALLPSALVPTGNDIL